jgi:hypothetical protein
VAEQRAWAPPTTAIMYSPWGCPMSVPFPWRCESPPAAHAAATTAPGRSVEFPAELHPLARQFLAYREGRLDGRLHSLEDAAERFGIDPPFARTVDEYLGARRRLRLRRAGWRASLAR